MIKKGAILAIAVVSAVVLIIARYAVKKAFSR
jgi:hypothetical protein